MANTGTHVARDGLACGKTLKLNQKIIHTPKTESRQKFTLWSPLSITNDGYLTNNQLGRCLKHML